MTYAFNDPIPRPSGPPVKFKVPPFEVFGASKLDRITHLDQLSAERRFAMRVVAEILPFRVNGYVLDRLIDWDDVPQDPIFQLTFPQPGMLAPEDFDRMATLLHRGAERAEIHALATEIRAGLNPHPAGQQTLNVPMLDGAPLAGAQHKYLETVLFFPAQGQTCHAYCSFCFRWAQFVGDKELKFAGREVEQLTEYLRRHREVTDLLVTGGDPMVMKTRHLERYLEPLLEPELDHVQTVRIGTKSLSFWPYRFVTDPDADELLQLFERLVEAGKHVALMAHVNHWRELDTSICHEAVRRIQATGAVIRTQAPLLAHVNDDPDAWETLWSDQVRLGIVPYYMFVERDTGAKRYFEVPLARALEIYRGAIRGVSGLGRTARGPVMSAGPGKVEVQGTTTIEGEKVFCLRFLQARNPAWVQRPFFARFDPNATWLDQLRPFGADRFFFEAEYEALEGRSEELRATARVAE
jgi:KamA family protein